MSKFNWHLPPAFLVKYEIMVHCTLCWGYRIDKKKYYQTNEKETNGIKRTKIPIWIKTERKLHQEKRSLPQTQAP